MPTIAIIAFVLVLVVAGLFWIIPARETKNKGGSPLQNTRKGLWQDRRPIGERLHLAGHERDLRGAENILSFLGSLSGNKSAVKVAGGPIKLGDDGWLIIPGMIVLIGVCAAFIGFLVFGINWKSTNFPDQTTVIASGAMPMGATFQVTPNTTYYLSDTAPIFDLQVGEQQERHDCVEGETLRFRVETQGTLLVDNFTSANVVVQTPEVFPGVVAVTCPKAGRLGLSQSMHVAAPTIPAPTQFATNTPAPTQVPTQEALVGEAPTVAPTATGEMNYATWVIYANAPQSPVWNFVQAESLGYYVYVLNAQPCQTPITLPAGYPNLQALIKISSSTYYADVVVSNNTVTVMCTGTFDLVALP